MVRKLLILFLKVQALLGLSKTAWENQAVLLLEKSVLTLQAYWANQG